MALMAFIVFNGTNGQLVQGNYIGTDASGTAPWATRYRRGHRVEASGNTIGGTTAGPRNVISGNG